MLGTLSNELIFFAPNQKMLFWNGFYIRVYFNYVDSVKIIYDHKDCYNFQNYF